MVQFQRTSFICNSLICRQNYRAANLKTQPTTSLSLPPCYSDHPQIFHECTRIRADSIRSFVVLLVQADSVVQTLKALALCIYFVRAGNQCSKVLTCNRTIAATNSPPTMRIMKGRTENMVSATIPYFKSNSDRSIPSDACNAKKKNTAPNPRGRINGDAKNPLRSVRERIMKYKSQPVITMQRNCTKMNCDARKDSY